jgi:hypothetical protein
MCRTCRANLDFLTFELARHCDDERTDVLTDIQQHRALASVTVVFSEAH